MTVLAPPLNIFPLERRHIEQAYPLMREIHPDLSIEEWKAYASRLIAAEERAGVIAAWRRRYVRGLYCFRVMDSLPDHQHRIFVASDLVALDLVARDEVMLSLIDDLQARALMHHCATIDLKLPTGSDWAADLICGMVDNARLPINVHLRSDDNYGLDKGGGSAVLPL